MTTEEETASKTVRSDSQHAPECRICQITFTDSNALARHRRREHVLETSVALGEYVIRVPLLTGYFRCPLANCDTRCKNVDSFKKHMTSFHGADVQVMAYDNEHDHVQKRRRMTSPPFDIHTGSRLALANNEQTAYHHAMAINCSPIAMHLNHHTASSSISAHALMQNDTIADVLAKIPFQDNCSESLECILQLHREDGQAIHSTSAKPIAANHVYIEKSIASSKLPGLIDAFSFKEATSELISFLNMDFRISPELLRAVALLHTGCIIVDEHHLVFTLTAEAYGRAKSLDAHGETNLKSIPVPGASAYEDLTIGIHEESDGGSPKKKLKIGSKTMNVLITMSTDVSKNEVSIGPGSHLSLNSTKTRIFYDEAKMKEFIHLSKDQETLNNPLNISSMRQLVSGFDKLSTYARWRATLLGFDTDLLQPATVFTITDLPGNQGYGHGDKSVIKTASFILQVVAIAVMKNGALHCDDFKHIDSRTEQHEDICKFLNHLNSEAIIRPLEVSSFILPICKLASQGLPKANQKIKANVETKLLELFGSCPKDS